MHLNYSARAMKIRVHRRWSSVFVLPSFQARAVKGALHCPAVPRGDREEGHGGGGHLQGFRSSYWYSGPEDRVWHQWVETPSFQCVWEWMYRIVDDIMTFTCHGGCLVPVCFLSLCTGLISLQIIKMCLWWWARWMSTPSLGPWSCTSESCQSLFSLMSSTPTLQAASVSHWTIDLQ